MPAFDWSLVAAAAAFALSGGLCPVALMLGDADCTECCKCGGADPREFGDPTPFSSGTWYYWNPGWNPGVSIGNWYDLCGWYTEKPGPVTSVGSGFTRRALSLPPPGATVHIYSPVTIEDDGKASSETVSKAYFWEAGFHGGTLYCSTAEFLSTVNPDSITNHGTIYGSVKFLVKATASVGAFGAGNRGIINGPVQLIGANNSGVVNGTAEFLLGETVPLPGKEEPPVVNRRMSTNVSLGGVVNGTAYFRSTTNSGFVAGHAIFYGDAWNSLFGFIANDWIGGQANFASFYDDSLNAGHVLVHADFYDSSSHGQSMFQNAFAESATFHDSACSRNTVYAFPELFPGGRPLRFAGRNNGWWAMANTTCAGTAPTWVEVDANPQNPFSLKRPACGCG
jgi:hypothetical protein